VAIDVTVPRPETSRLPFGLARLAAIPARYVVGFVVAASFGFRLLAGLAHATPLYFSDEYIYSTLARSLATVGKPVIRGGPAHFPALLEPILATPFWLFHDPTLAYRLTQAENSLFMSLAAIPVYLLCRKLGLGAWLAIAAGALTVASPDLFYTSFVLADPLAYLLVLSALYAGVCALAIPTRRAQVAFVALAGLATFARVQYALLPLVFAVAAVVVERGNVRRAVSRYRLTLAIFAAPVLAFVAIGPTKVLGYYSGLAKYQIHPLTILHWIGTDSMLLAYAGGLVLVPGALVGLAYALRQPLSREESAFAGLALALGGAVFVEAALYASNGSARFQERYFMVLLPLVIPLFGLYLKRGLPARIPTTLGALALLVISSRVPLSGYTVGDGKQDSPFLFGVFQLEKLLSVGDGSLVVALVAGAMACLAMGIALRRRFVAAAIVATLAVSCSVSLGAIRFDTKTAREIRDSYLPRDLSWIDHAHLGSVYLVQTPATPHVRAHEELFWNTSLKQVLLFGQASPIDAFRYEHLTAAADGRLLLHGNTLRKPLAISNYAVQVQLTGANRIARGGTYDLWRPSGTPRFALFSGGLYHDGWLAESGHFTVYPDASGRVRGTLGLVVSLPKGTQRTILRFRGPGIHRTESVSPRRTRTLEFRVNHAGAWQLNFKTPRPGYLRDGRPISVRAKTPTFSRS
jgi:hypothetical protein